MVDIFSLRLPFEYAFSARGSVLNIEHVYYHNIIIKKKSVLPISGKGISIFKTNTFRIITEKMESSQNI